jgi:hypothetical protein
MSPTHAYLVVERYWGASSHDDVSSGAATAEQLATKLRAAVEREGYPSIAAFVESSAALEHKETPSRVLGVRRLFSEGLLDASDPTVEVLREARAIPETLWRVLRTVDPITHRLRPADSIGAPPRNPSRTISWAISLVDGDGKVTPLDLDPKHSPGSQLPVALIAKTLAYLERAGWTVLNLSEDRGVNDDASESFVVRQRYLLHRRTTEQ